MIKIISKCTHVTRVDPLLISYVRVIKSQEQLILNLNAFVEKVILVHVAQEFKNGYYTGTSTCNRCDAMSLQSTCTCMEWIYR